MQYSTLRVSTTIVGITDSLSASLSFPSLRVGMKCPTLRVSTTIVGITDCGFAVRITLVPIALRGNAVLDAPRRYHDCRDYGLLITDYGFAFRITLVPIARYRD